MIEETEQLYGHMVASGSEITATIIAQKGAKGNPGEDGYSPTANVTKTDNVSTITITDKNGTTTATVSDGVDGIDGQDGYTPVKGVDYFTEADIESLNIPTKVSDLTNDSGFITNTVNNLTNYYLKSETYNKSEVDTLIANVNSFNVEIVQSLPTTDIDLHTIYLVPKTGSGTDVYNEYIYINNNWELIGNTAVDLSNYYTKSETDTLLNGKADISDIPTKISDLTNDSDFIETSSTAGLVKNDGTIDTTSYSTFSGSYNDLSNKPTIPTVNDSTITIQSNGTTIDSFTTNASSNKTINIPSKDIDRDIFTFDMGLGDDAAANIAVAQKLYNSISQGNTNYLIFLMSSTTMISEILNVDYVGNSSIILSPYFNNVHLSKQTNYGFTNLYVNRYVVNISLENDDVTGVSFYEQYTTDKIILAAENYTTPYTPQYDSSPVPKKYVDDTLLNLAPKYSSSSTYSVGDYVIYNNLLYVCNTAIITAEAWTAAHWTQKTMAGIVGNIESLLSEV